MPLLEMRHITKAFNGVCANEDVSLTAHAGEIHALLGENGAGKTTLMNILFGIYQADSGEIVYEDKSVRFASPRDAIDHGIGMVHQHFSLVNCMSVLDNIILGLPAAEAVPAKDCGGRAGLRRLVPDRRAAAERISQLAERYGLAVRPQDRVGDLTVGERQRVEILKALYRNVRLLILDEPTGVLTPQETENFFGVLRRLKEEGHGVIIITHRLAEIMAISDRVTILRDGRVAGQTETASTTAEELSAMMIGRSLSGDLREEMETEAAGTAEAAGDFGALLLENVSIHARRDGKKHLSDVSLRLNPGEILGVAGVEGNGQKELAEAITGVRRIGSGRILFDGEDISHLPVRERFNRGISYISDDRHGDSLVMDMTVTENLILREYGQAPYSHGGILDYARARERAGEALREYRIKTSGAGGIATPVRLMSGGNQQKVILAREISRRARLIVASQPTRGLDIGATEFVHRALLKQRREGHSVVLISADLDEILALSDRIAVMFGGRLIGILDRREADVVTIGLMMGGVAPGEKEGKA